MCCTWTSIWDAITLSKIQYLNIALGGTAERTSMLHQVRSALIWLWIRQTSYFRRHFIVFHLVQCCTLDIVWYSWVRDIAVHLETDLDILCIGNLGYLLQQTRDTLQHFILHTFQTTSSSATTVVRPERFAAFRSSFMGQEWTLSRFPLSVFSVLCPLYIFCTVFWGDSVLLSGTANNPSLRWFHEYQIVKQSVGNKSKEEKKRGKVLVPNYSKVEPFSWVDDPSASVTV